MNISSIPIGESLKIFEKVELCVNPNDQRMRDTHDFNVIIFYKRNSEFEHTFQFKIEATFMSKSPLTHLKFIIAPTHQLTLSEKFNFSKKLTKYQIGAIYDVFLECLRGAFEFAKNAVKQYPDIKDALYAPFTEDQIILRLQANQMRDYIETTSVN